MDDYEVKPAGEGKVADTARVCFYVEFVGGQDEDYIRTIAEVALEKLSNNLYVRRAKISAIYPIWD